LSDKGPVTENNPLVLASASPRRKMLLDQLQIPHYVRESTISEDGMDGEAAEVAMELARMKALAVHDAVGPFWVLGADTVVVLEGLILGKPAAREDAFRMLGRLGGNVHNVITGFCITGPEGSTAHLEAVDTTVKMKALTDEEIEGYIDSGEPFGKAGSYAIQGLGAFMVEEICGSYTNVVGLPLCELVRALISSGALLSYPLKNG